MSRLRSIENGTRHRVQRPDRWCLSSLIAAVFALLLASSPGFADVLDSDGDDGGLDDDDAWF